MNTLISQSLKQGDVHLLFGFPQALLKKNEQKWVQWIQEYTVKHGQPPTLLRFQEHFSTFVEMETLDPLLDVYEQELVRKRNHYTKEYLMGIQDELKGGADPLPYIQELYDTIKGGGGDVSRFSSFDRTAYFRRPTTYNYGIGQLDKFTGGVAKGDLVYLIARLGVGKTTVSLYLMTKWALEGQKVLIVSNENRPDDIIAKMDSFIGGFNPIKKRTMDWSEEDKMRIETVTHIARSTQGDVFIPNRPVQNMRELYGYVHTYEPDIIFVDGIYLMDGASGDSHWEKVTSVSRELKKMAEGEGKPVIATHQANRQAIGKRIDIEHIAYADAIGQDADAVLTIKAEEDGSLFLEGIKNRWGTKAGWGMFLEIHFETMSVKVREVVNAR